jgi:hypothetical protein
VYNCNCDCDYNWTADGRDKNKAGTPGDSRENRGVEEE